MELVLSEGEPGQFDGHGRRLSNSAGTGGRGGTSIASRQRTRSIAGQAGRHGRFRNRRPGRSSSAGDRDPCAAKRWSYSSGHATNFRCAEATPSVVLALPKALYIRDIRGGAGWQHTSRLELRLDPVAPTLLVLSEAELPGLTLTLPASAVAGLTVQAHFALTGDNPAGPHALHVEIQDPTGQIVRLYSGNALLRGLSLDWPIPVAVNDSPGTWTVRARDILSGNATSATFTVKADLNPPASAAATVRPEAGRSPFDLSLKDHAVVVGHELRSCRLGFRQRNGLRTGESQHLGVVGARAQLHEYGQAGWKPFSGETNATTWK